MHSVLKANWDASMNSQNSVSGMGGIVRDFEGNVLVSIYSRFITIQKPVVTEALALCRLMQFCSILGPSQVLFEGDCLQLIHVVTTSTEECIEI